MGEAELIFVDPLTHREISTQKSGIFLQSTKQKYDESVKGRFTRNILHWNENDIKTSQTTNVDYSKYANSLTNNTKLLSG